MLVALESHFTKTLKIILHSKIFYSLWIVAIFLFVLFSFQKPKKILKEETIFVEGKIIEYKWNEDAKKIELILKKKKENILLFYDYQEEEKEKLEQEIQYGKTLTAIGTKMIPKSNTILNTFNYQKYLKSLGYDYYIVSSEITLTGSENLHDKIHEKLRDYLNQKKKNVYYKTLILGLKENWDKNLDKMFRENGISHIFVISGLHLGFLFLILQNGTKKILKNKKIQSFLSFFLLSCYYSFLTKSISSERVYGFLFLTTLNEIGNLKLNTKQIYLLNLGVRLIKNPFLINNIGFQYSSILSFAFLFFKFQDKSKWKKRMKNSILAFFVSLPITINQTFMINPWSILINLIMIPFMSAFLIPLLLLSLVIPFLESGVNLFLNLMEWSNNLFYHLPFSHITIPKMPTFLFLSYYGCLILTRKKKQWKIMILWIFCWFISILLIKFDSSTYFYFLDVSQGDSTLIISPYQKEVILLDTGKESKTFKENIILFLKSIGINKINYLILSHGDYDHMGAAISLVENIKIEKVIFNCGDYNDLEKKLIKILDKKNVKYYTCIKELNINNNKLFFLNTKEYDNENDNSNVIYTKINNYKFLLMGDASTIVEKEILKEYNLSQVDVLKVSHHGSKTSSSKEFINTINPKYSIISVGKNNRYGHPNKEVLENLNESKIYRTDKDGSIMFKIKNNKLKNETCPP